ncbi:uncharacterized protein TNCV_2170651, partial [Trichonephila clavipes]
MYELTTVTYGTVSAPYLATRTLKQLAMDEANNFSLAAPVVLSDCYMDDIISGSESIEEIPAQLACAYLKGHLKGRALDWFEVLGYRVIEDKTTDYAHLKQALSEQFPVVRNRSELETRFYSSSQRRDQQPSDFIYELLKIHKVLKLEMSEEKLIDHVVSRLEPQILDYVEVRHPRNTANLLQIVDKYEERFMHRQIR